MTSRATLSQCQTHTYFKTLFVLPNDQVRYYHPYFQISKMMYRDFIFEYIFSKLTEWIFEPMTSAVQVITHTPPMSIYFFTQHFIIRCMKLKDGSLHVQLYVQLYMYISYVCMSTQITKDCFVMSKIVSQVNQHWFIKNAKSAKTTTASKAKFKVVKINNVIKAHHSLNYIQHIVKITLWSELIYHFIGIIISPH